MRYVVLALLLLGCNPGQMATGAPPTKETIVESLERYEALVAKHAESVGGKVDGLAETVGNATSELEAVKEELKGVQASQKKILDLLTVVEQPPIEVPQLAPPVKADAPPKDSDRHTASLSFQGKPIDVSAWLRRSVTTVEIRGDVDKHLRDHGLEGDFSRYSRQQLIHLHSVAHTYGIPLKSTAPRKVAAAKPAPVVRPFVQYGNGNCKNGNCARSSSVWYWRR